MKLKTYIISHHSQTEPKSMTDASLLKTYIISHHSQTNTDRFHLAYLLKTYIISHHSQTYRIREWSLCSLRPILFHIILKLSYKQDLILSA